MSVERAPCKTVAAKLRPRDRFSDGWVVKRTVLREDGAVAVIIGKAGRPGEQAVLYPADREVTVLRPLRPAPGLYVRQDSTNRETGTRIVVGDTTAPGSPWKPERDMDGKVVNRWMTECIDHSMLCSHPTLALALSHAACPSGWCEGCQHVAAGCTCTHEAGVIEVPSSSCPVHGWMTEEAP